MPLLEQDYCVEQINVPPKLPRILKQFCKSAIRTQPYDLLKWSSAYFRALAEGEEPPAKLRLEYPPSCTAHGLTLGFLKVLLRQLGPDYNKALPLEKILERWDYLCLDRRDSSLIIEVGRFRDRCQIKRFLSIACGLLARGLAEAMILVCELFTHEPEGGSAMIPVSLFMQIYGYLASLRCDGGTLCPSSDATLPSSAKTLEEASGQDTDLELESLSKDDAPSARTLQSFGDEMDDESYLHEGEASLRSTEEERRSRTVNEETPEKPASSASDGAPQQNASSSSSSSLSSGSSDGCECDDSLRPNYPDVPGIGRRLPAEEVAAVAIWMSECARRQGGMVGPRNVRHIACPPLEGSRCSSARSQDDCSARIV